MAGREVITLDSDSDEDEELRRAIALSLQSEDAVPNDGIATVGAGDKRSDTPGNRFIFGSETLNRKEMEEARLERLEKRRRSHSNGEEPPRKRAIHQQTPRAAFSQPQYSHGTVRRTWARGYPKTPECITVEEVLQKDELQLAVISSFQWDEEWMLSKLNVDETHILLLAFAKDEEQKRSMMENAPKNVRFCFPPMSGLGAMHSKLQLLKYPNYLRIVIPTGNMVSYDWGETGVMENMVFIIDLPRLGDECCREVTSFEKNLEYFLRAAGVGDTMTRSLAKYNFAATKNLGFVFSIPGGHKNEALHRVGYCGLGETVKGLGLATNKPVEIDLVCASIGAIKWDFVQAIYNACQGDDGMQEYNARVGGKVPRKEPYHSKTLLERFRIYFPSNQTVAKSKGGRQAAGTICAQARWWNAPNFPAQLIRDCINNRTGLLMHSKIIFVRNVAEREILGQNFTGWAYIGSANLSESAWGRLVKDKFTGNAKMSCRNWECGVLVPAEASVNGDGGFGMFSKTIPVPMIVPGRPYSADDGPWLFSAS